MQIYIMRHGEAQDFFGQGCVEDSERALSANGEAEAQEMANWFSKMDIRPNQVFVSPFVRAEQTCAIVTSKMAATISTLDFITPLDEAKPVHDFIDGWVSEQCACSEHKEEEGENILLIVSHMPLVCYLVAELTQSDNAPIFATAGVAQIDYDCDKMQGTLVNMTSPKL